MLKGDLEDLDKSKYVMVKKNRKSGDLNSQTLNKYEEENPNQQDGVQEESK